MATELSFFSGATRRIVAKPNTLLHDAIFSNLHTGETFVAATTGCMIINKLSDIKPGQLVGTVPWNVLYSGDITERMDKLEHDLRETQNEIIEQRRIYSEDAIVWGKTFIQNTATQLLLFVIGPPSGQPRNSSESTRFRCLDNARFRAFKPDENDRMSFANTADRIVTRRNHTLHFVDKDALHAEVVRAQELLDRYPKLRRACSDESMVLEAYPQLKDAFEF